MSHIVNNEECFFKVLPKMLKSYSKINNAKRKTLYLACAVLWTKDIFARISAKHNPLISGENFVQWRLSECSKSGRRQREMAIRNPHSLCLVFIRQSEEACVCFASIR